MLKSLVEMTIFEFRHWKDRFTPLPHRGVHAGQPQRRDKADLLLTNHPGNRKGLGHPLQFKL